MNRCSTQKNYSLLRDNWAKLVSHLSSHQTAMITSLVCCGFLFLIYKGKVITNGIVVPSLLHSQEATVDAEGGVSETLLIGQTTRLSSRSFLVWKLLTSQNQASWDLTDPRLMQLNEMIQTGIPLAKSNTPKGYFTKYTID